MTSSKAKILLASVIIARSTSFLFAKTALQTMDRFQLLSVRFQMAFFLLSILFFRQLLRITLHTLLRGVALGTVLFIVMTLELTALKTAETSTTAFLENTAIIYVPLITAMLSQKLPDLESVIRAAAALAGIGVMTLRGAGFFFSPGELYAMTAAAFYACFIILTAKFSRGDDPLMLGTVQVGTLGILALAASLSTGTARLPRGGTEWISVVALALVCTGFGFTLQPVAQKYLKPEEAGMFCALTPVSAMITGALILHESVTPFKILGATLILGSILLPKLPCRTARLRSPGKSPGKTAAGFFLPHGS